MKGGQSHDIVLRSRDSELGLMLAEDEGRKLWQVTEAPTFAPRMSIDSASYAQFPPEQEVVIAFADWTGGMGQAKYGVENKFLWARPADTRYASQMIAGPLVTLTYDSGSADLGAIDSHLGFAELLDKVFCISQDGTNVEIWEWDNTNSYWTQRKQITSTDADGLIGFATWGVAAVGGSIYYSTDKTTWAEKASTDCRKGMAVIKGVLWGASATGVRSCTDPSGTWSTIHTIGDSWADITSLVNCNDILFVGKEDGLWSFDEGKEVNLIPEYRFLKSAYNFAAIDCWYGKVYASVGESGLICYDPISGAIQDISPARYLQSQTNIISAPSLDIGIRVRSLTHDENWLYATLECPTATGDSHLLAGRWMPDGSFAWHILLFQSTTADSNQLNASLVTSIDGSNPKLWISWGTTTGGGDPNNPAYVILQKGHFNPIRDSTYKHTTRSDWYSSWIDFGFVDIPKALLYLTCETNNCTSTEYIKFAITLDEEGGTAYWVGEVYKDGKTTLYFKPLSAEENKVSCRRCMVRVNITTAGSTTSPILLSLALHAVLRPQIKHAFNFSVRCADNIPSLTAAAGPHTGRYIAQTLRNFRDTVYPITLEDNDGEKWDVSMIDVKEEFITKPVNKDSERVVHITAIEQTTDGTRYVDPDTMVGARRGPPPPG